jgi:uncharacterized protein YndB with AHSA1/START domain
MKSVIFLLEEVCEVGEVRMESTADAETVEIEIDGPIWLKLGMSLPTIAPEETLRWFIDPQRLARWWGEVHSIESVPGGRYEIQWPSMNRSMRGAIIRSQPCELVFSWGWDHEPNLPARVVMVKTCREGCGTRVSIVHGPYRPAPAELGAEEDDRAGHREGWLYFLPKLKEAIMERAASPSPAGR